ncbi:MAG: hypothetical protein KGD65_06745 [Candidatus Lokiarchaeota archaeon]|nr:hypothetical protein [Candidatus Lokiarchaeota archaeon]
MLIVSEIALERAEFRVIIKDNKFFSGESIEIKDGDRWIPILENLDGLSTLTFWANKEKSSKRVIFERRKKKKLYYNLQDEDITLNLDYCLEENNILHIRYKFSTNKDLELSKIAVFYKILLGNAPDFTWVPHIRPRKNLVIGDHVFRSPVIIYKKGNVAFAMIPDLKTLGQNRPFQTFMDLNLSSDNFSKSQYIAYGFGNYKPHRHVYFKHNTAAKWKIDAGTDLMFRYYIISFRGQSVSEILFFINNFLWEKYGRRNLYQNLNPQIVPYDINVKEGFEALFERQNYWGDLKMNNVECGGFWVSTWVGKEKLPLNFIKKNNIRDYTQNYSKRHRIAVIFNTAWFLNIRSAYGLRYFGELWKREDLLMKGKKMLNLILQLPRNKGIFPSLVLPSSSDSIEFSTVKGVKAWQILEEEYNLVDASLTMYWAIKYSNDFNYLKESVKEVCKDLVTLIKDLQLENGEIPTFITFDDNNEIIINDDLSGSASSGASLMFLLEYYKLTNDNNILLICERIAEFIIAKIIPEDKWLDFEAFYSCTHPLYTEYDTFTRSYVMNNLCIYWCAEGFKDLYRATGKERYIEFGERILAIMSLFQQVWDMPYINYHTFGGFGCQNTDAELGDARQGLFVKTYMEYYLETGKEEYMERGIAALRASWALQILREYEEICPGNLTETETIDTIDRGLIRENYGHAGYDKRISNYIMLDWGIGTAATASAYAKKHFGDLFIDFKNRFVFGIDGILMKRFDFNDRQVLIEFDLINKKETLIVKARDVPFDLIELIFNKESVGNFKKDDLEKGFMKNIR